MSGRFKSFLKRRKSKKQNKAKAKAEAAAAAEAARSAAEQQQAYGNRMPLSGSMPMNMGQQLEPSSIAELLHYTQAQLDDKLTGKNKENRWSSVQDVQSWLSNEISICAAEFAVHDSKQRLVNPSREGTTKYLMQRISHLGHHFAACSKKYLIASANRGNSDMFESAITDLVGRLASEFGAQKQDAESSSSQKSNAAGTGAAGATTASTTPYRLPGRRHEADATAAAAAEETDSQQNANAMQSVSEEAVIKILGKMFWLRRLAQLLLLGAKANNLVLVSHIADSKIIDVNVIRSGQTALHVASAHGKVDIVDFLVHRIADDGGKLNVKTPGSGYSPLHDAAVHGHEDIVRLLISMNPNMMEEPTRDKWTPLLLAVANRQTRCANFLIWKGGSLTAQNKWGRCALDYARSDSKMWHVFEMNIPSLKDIRHRAQDVQIAVIKKHQDKFAYQSGQEAQYVEAQMGAVLQDYN
jgi:Ankyrin repeats (3 copies)/Ankyrin repeat